VSARQFSPGVVLVTGGAGFIGSNLVRWLLDHEPELQVVNLDLLTYAGNLESLADVEERWGSAGERRYRFVHGDIRDASLVARLLSGAASTSGASVVSPPPDAVLHLAAESHVDRSILGPADFVSSNVQGTLNLLMCTRAELEARPRPFRFVNISTDEVYGSLGPEDPPFTERSSLSPNSPYAASKAGADCLVRAFAETYGLPCLTTRCSNNYGPYQFPEKLIPLMITRALDDQPLPVYGDGLNVRDWLHVHDHAAAIWTVCTKGHLEDKVYNIGGESEIPNIAVVRQLLDALGKPERLISYVRDRPGHDRRYAMDISFIRARLGWSPEYAFDAGIPATVQWYLEHRQWWKRVQSEAYQASNALYGGDRARLAPPIR
jgi:dTDP-glucose 4,6-dehydratase